MLEIHGPLSNLWDWQPRNVDNSEQKFKELLLGTWDNTNPQILCKDHGFRCTRQFGDSLSDFHWYIARAS